jgi:hypothetical protein
MSEHKDKRCFVLLPAGNPHYVTLFEELFSLAIMKAGLIPYRLQQSPTTPLPIEMLVQELAAADAVFADLSQNDVDIWFALGCALTLSKPLCLVSSRLEFSLPLDIQDLEIIPYPVTAFPSDFKDLQQNITEQLLAQLPQIPISQIPASQIPVAQIPAPQVPVPPSAPSPLDAVIPLTTPAFPSLAAISDEDLTTHEVLALTIIDLKASENGLSPRDLGLEMKVNECAHLTSHAMNALKRKRLIERRSVPVTDGNERYFSDNLFVTRSGEEWLIRHGKRRTPRSNSAMRELFIANR